MFTVIYSFQVKPDAISDFIEGWEGLTKLIYEYEGSLGSRLHKVNDELFIAYAQWPNKSTWENSGDKLPAEANTYRTKMKESCSSIKTEHTMDVVSDLLK